MISYLKTKFQNENAFKYTLFLFVFIAVAISLIQYFAGDKFFWDNYYTHYNNFVIFKNSFKHLIDNENLYAAYPKEYGDYYKYSPAFALFMSLFYYLPDWLGLIFWNLLNSLVLFFSIKNLPGLNKLSKFFILFFIQFELITTLQNSQSNALIAGLIIFSFVNFEKKNYFIGCFCIMLCFYIKIIGLVVCSLVLLYPKKNKFILYTIFWGLIFALLPLAVINPTDLFEQYKNWLLLINRDSLQSYGISIFGIINSWFQIELSKPLILITGAILFCTPFLRRNLYKEYYYRLLFLTSILLWIVIFNHKGESPTYIIALTGCGIWYIVEKKSLVNNLLIVLAFILISLSPTDLFPKYLRENYVIPLILKALPAILIWFKLIYDMNFNKHNEFNLLNFSKKN